MTEELADISAFELGALYEKGEASPVDVLDAVWARVDRLEPAIHATFQHDRDGSRRAARNSEQRWRDGTPLGPLDGVPATIKDQIALIGTNRPLGTAATESPIDTVDGPASARLREAGAVIFAKTTMPDYGMLSSGLSSYHELARNPWNLNKTPGGSSAGAGAAAAAGYGPLHVGTDIGGSIRLPAGWCGLVGLKPSHGRIPVDPPYIGRAAGPMTRTVTDAALMMSALSKPDSRDFMALPPADIAWLGLKRDVRGLRIGLMVDAGCGLETDPEVVIAVEKAAKIFADAGAIIEPVEPFMTQDLLDGFDHFFRTRFWDETRSLPPERYAKILRYIRSWVEGAATYDFLTAYRGYGRLVKIQEAGNRLLDSYDFVLSPVSPVTAFPAEFPSPNNDPARPFEHIGYTVAYNMTQQPACSINCGFASDGLPIGLQIVGRRFDDLGVLQMAYWFETARGEQPNWPLAKAKA